MKKYTIWITIIVCATIIYYSCKRDFTNYEKPVDEQHIVIGQSDSKGEANLELENNTLNILVRDASTGEKIEGYEIRMVQKDSLISLFGYDSQGRYLHKIDGLVLDSKKGIISIIWDIIDCYILTGETIYSSGTINDQALIAALFGGTFISETETTLLEMTETIAQSLVISELDDIVSVALAVPTTGATIVIELVSSVAGFTEAAINTGVILYYLSYGYEYSDPFIVRKRVYTSGLVLPGGCVSHFVTIEPKYQLDDPLYNTGSVSLKLNDITTNDPISGARVSVIPGGTSPINFYSNQNGEVEIGNIKNGTHTITISHEDYLPATLNNIEVIFNQTNNLGVIKLASILPVVNTLSVNDINSNSAKAGGNILFSGPTQVSSRGVCWSLNQNPTIADNKTTDGNGTGQFPSTITGLSSNTKYYLRAYATNSAGTAYGQQISFTTLTESGEAPVADFTANPTLGDAPLEVSFTDQSTNDPTSWLWDFGDGTTSTQQNPTKIYSSAGTYTVKLTASNSNGLNTTVKNDFVLVRTGGGVGGNWSQLNSLSFSALYGTVFSIGNFIYIETGSSDNGFWEYNPINETLIQKAEFPGSASYMSVGFSIANKGYIALGLYGGQEVWEYDPVSNTWSQKADFPGPPRIKAVSFVIDNKAYIATGGGDDLDLNDLWEFDPSNDSWTQKANMPGIGRGNAFAFTINNKGYVGTGDYYIDGFRPSLKDFYEYDPLTDGWSRKADVGEDVRYGAFAFTIDGYGYVGGGYDVTYPGGGEPRRDFWKYDPITNTWTQLSNISFDKSSGDMSLSVGNLGYVLISYGPIFRFNPYD